MSKAGQTLHVGDEALTDYNGGPYPTLVTITKRVWGQKCQSGILFCVTPALKGNPEDAQFDAHWFEPLPGKSK